MLRCGLHTTRDFMQKQTGYVADLAFCPHQIRRSASQWQNKGSGSKTKGATPRIRKMPSRLDVAEKETKRDIRKLREKLVTEEKIEDAKVAHEAMGELDENTLEMIYTAINTPDPSTPEELRLEARRRRIPNKLNDTNTLYLETERGKNVARRLTALNERLQQLQVPTDLDSDVGQGTEKDKQTEVYDRVSFLLKSIGAPSERSDKEDRILASTSTSESVSKSTEGIVFFTDAGAREELLGKVQNLANILNTGSQEEKGKESTLPLGIATKQEWEALAICFAHANDMVNVQNLLKAIEQSGHQSSLLRVINVAIDVYANQGDVEKCQALTAWMTEKGLSPDNFTHHCLVKSYLRNKNLDQALDLIYKLEDVQPASLMTYTLTLSSLLHWTKNPAIQSKVWHLFNRMRLVAHPIPDAPCYAVMIKACALGVPQVNDSLWKPSKKYGQSSLPRKSGQGRNLPDAERGLDLFREMTNRYAIRPDVEAYSALIDCCTGREDMYEKAWQLFRNMVEMDRHRVESEGEDIPSLAPTRKIFNSLLSGCRRKKDLLRARWILAEMLRSASIRWQKLMKQEREGKIIESWKLLDIERSRPDQTTMSEIFLTYANYQLPPNVVKMAASEEAMAGRESEATVVIESQDGVKDQLSQAEQEQPRELNEDIMTYNIPSTRRALLREANSLMERIKIDYQQQGGLLSNVKPNATLIHSYLRVLAQYCRKDDVEVQLRQVTFGTGSSEEGNIDTDSSDSNDGKSLFDLFNVQVNGLTFMTLLQHISQRDRADNLVNFAWQIWDKYITFGGDSDTHLKDPAKALRKGLNSQCLGETWASMIRILAIYGQLDEAVTLLRRFAELYPPPVSQQEQEASSSSLLSPIRGEDIVRLEKRSPRSPTLDFKQLSILHMRLVESENHEQDISFIKWLTMSYNPIAKMPDPPTKSSTGQKQVQKFLKERTPNKQLNGAQMYLSTL